MKRQETGKCGERSQRQICCPKRQGFVSPMTPTAIFSSRTIQVVTAEESPTQGTFMVTNSPDFIFLLIPSPYRSVSTPCLPENWQENEGRRMCSSPGRYLLRPQTRLLRVHPETVGWALPTTKGWRRWAVPTLQIVASSVFRTASNSQLPG